EDRVLVAGSKHRKTPCCPWSARTRRPMFSAWNWSGAGISPERVQAVIVTVFVVAAPEALGVPEMVPVPSPLLCRCTPAGSPVAFTLDTGKAGRRHGERNHGLPVRREAGFQPHTSVTGR